MFRRPDEGALDARRSRDSFFGGTEMPASFALFLQFYRQFPKQHTGNNVAERP